MKTKIVYVVVSSEHDIYLEQAYISMYSLKRHMPEAHIVMLTDIATAESLTGIRKEETKFIDEMIVAADLDSNKLNAQQRSRQLKTSVRSRVEGDFLFIDCDTIITRSLNDIEETAYDIAACRDTHSSLADNPYRGMTLMQGYALGYPIEEETVYYNSGVIYVKDTPNAHAFYQQWNKNLNEGYQHNIFMDQPSFAKTNKEMEHVVGMLDDVWNCELKHGIRYLKDAYIVHYLCTNPSSYQNHQLFVLNEKSELMKIKEEGKIPENILKTIDDPFKGIAEITHCFAGEDVYFFQSPIYQYVRSHYKREQNFSFLFFAIRMMGVAERLYKHVVRVVQGRASLRSSW